MVYNTKCSRCEGAECTNILKNLNYTIILKKKHFATKSYTNYNCSYKSWNSWMKMVHKKKIIHHFTIVHIKKRKNIRMKFVFALPHIIHHWNDTHEHDTIVWKFKCWEQRQTNLQTICNTVCISYNWIGGWQFEKIQLLFGHFAKLWICSNTCCSTSCLSSYIYIISENIALHSKCNAIINIIKKFIPFCAW